MRRTRPDRLGLKSIASGADASLSAKRVFLCPEMTARRSRGMTNDSVVPNVRDAGRAFTRERFADPGLRIDRWLAVRARRRDYRPRR